jgi:hypothetical protein
VAVIHSDDFSGAGTLADDGYRLYGTLQKAAVGTNGTQGVESYLGAGGAQWQSQSFFVKDLASLAHEGATAIDVHNYHHTVWAPGSQYVYFINVGQYLPSSPGLGNESFSSIVAVGAAGATTPRSARIRLYQPSETEGGVDASWPEGYTFNLGWLFYTLEDVEFDPSAYNQYDVQYRMGSVVGGAVQADGFVCVRLNGVVIFSAEDVPLGWTSETNPTNGYNYVSIMPQGAVDNLEVRDDATPCTVAAEDCPCPPPDGPGRTPGAPTGTGPIGGGGFGNSGTNEGGELGTWTEQCDGGGVVGSYAIASAGESMIGVREPRIWTEIAFDDGEAYWAQDVTIPDPAGTYGGRKSGRILGISKISRSLSDDNGNYSGAKVTVQLNDKDRASLRARLGTSAGRYVWEREGIIRIASEANRRSGYATPPRELFRGVSRDVALAGRFTGSISFEDRVCSQFGQFGPDRKFSSRLLSLGLLPNCPRELVGKPQQWIFGIVSDQGSTHPETGELAEKGLVPIWYVGTDGGQDAYHLAAHAVKDVALYGSNGETPPARVLLDPGSYTVEMLDLEDADTGKTHRVTHILIPSDSVASQAHKSGQLNMAANVCGVEDVGDGSGTVITDLFSIYQFIFEHLILPAEEHHTGAYPGSPQWADGRYMVHSDSFAAAQAYSVERIRGTGYQGGFVLGGPASDGVPLRELLKRMSNSGDCWFAWSHAGQVKVVLLDDTASLSGSTILSEPAGLREMPTPVFEFDEVENPVLFSYDFDDDKQKPRVAQESVKNETAIERLGGRERPSPSPIAMRCVREAETARDVAQRRLMRRKYPPAYYPVVASIDGVDIEPGDLIRITSQEGVGDGSDERPLFVRDWAFNPKTMRTHLYCRDLTDILESNTLQDHEDADVILLKAHDDEDVLALR